MLQMKEVRLNPLVARFGVQRPPTWARPPHAATVWHGTDAELTKIDQVQTRVLRRLAATRDNLADDFLWCRTSSELA